MCLHVSNELNTPLQAKLRLEMAQERLRQQHSKEVEEKENDLEELKRSFHKKVLILI